MNNNLFDKIRKSFNRKQKEALSTIEEFKETILSESRKTRNDPILFVHEYCSEIKRQIDLKVEIEKNKMDDLREEFIKQIETIENECKEKIKTEEFQQELNKFDKLIKNFEEKCTKWSQELNEIKIENELISINEECETLKQELEKKKKELEKNLLNKKIKFIQNEKIPSFGELKIINRGEIDYEDIHVKTTLTGHNDYV